jgi:selenocysteine insertion sequence-binding protein 2
MNFAEADEVEDEDEYHEIVENVKEMATKVGPIRDAFVFRKDSGPCPAIVWFETPKSCAAACACWDGLVVGGQKLEPVLLYPELNEGGSPGAWREAVTGTLLAEKNSNTHPATSNDSTRIVLKNVLKPEDFEDTDQREESLSYIRSLAEKHGTVSDIAAKQDESGGIIIISYIGNASVANEAVAKLDGLLVGRSAVSAFLCDETEAMTKEHVIELKNALTEDDLEDEDCLKESLSDIESLAKKFGPLSDTGAIMVDRSTVRITYGGDLSAAKNAAAKLDGTLLGGNILQATVLSVSNTAKSEDSANGWVLLQNILTEEDITDEECMEESIEDVRELASQYGKVLNITFDPKDLTRVVRVEYDGGSEVATFAANKFNNMVLGGQTIAATSMAQASDRARESSTGSVPSAESSRKRPADATPKPMYSGDKLIPERFAEAKRVPKVVTSTGPRDYASISKSEEVVPLLIEMLGELMRLQRRAIEDKNAKARRRLVMGLREVARGIRAHKVKMVVLANNVDQYGAIDAKLQEILDLARQEDVPVIFELNKRKLGKAVGKSIKVSVVGIQNADGAHQQFKKLVNLASK